MSERYYILNEDHTIGIAKDILEWADQFESAILDNKRRVALDIINDYKVSTVWLGMHHGYDNKMRPLLFETMVFEPFGQEDRYTDRYATWDEAVIGHEKAKQWVLGGCKDE